MKVSGFTFLRNADINGYPFVESIKSILPIVDEFICVVGKGVDSTREMVEGIGDEKIRIIDSVWNEKMCDRGFVYGQQKMIGQFNCSGDWAFYLEGDEVLHEDELDSIRSAMEVNLHSHEVESLYFDFYHFYGTPNQIGIAGYRRAPRIIRNTIRSVAPDGLFWVVLDGNKRGRYPTARYAGGSIYHYGHCRSVAKMDAKVRAVGKYWAHAHGGFDTYGNIDTAELRAFSGSHPGIMREWLESEAERSFCQSSDYTLTRRDVRNRLRFWIESKFAFEISKKHYIDLDRD